MGRDGRMSIVEIATESARVRIAPDVGGSIVGFTLDDAPILRPTPDAAIAAGDVRQAACYPLVPYSNRIAHARLHFGGREFVLARNFGTHPHAIHGVGWQRAWSVIEASPRAARLALRHDAQRDTAAWPWSFDATQTFHLTEDRRALGPMRVLLVVTLSVANTGSEPFPFGLGWHPFFPKHATTRLGFAADAVWRNDATQLPQQHVAMPPEWRFDPPQALDAIACDNVFTGWRGTATLVEPAGRLTVLDADRACTCLVIYAPPGRDFVAVEPVTHETDAFNRAAIGASRTGMRVLPPGAAFSCTMRVAAAAFHRSASPIP
jgi:aldose 1-epimerase